MARYGGGVGPVPRRPREGDPGPRFVPQGWAWLTKAVEQAGTGAQEMLRRLHAGDLEASVYLEKVGEFEPVPRRIWGTREGEKFLRAGWAAFHRHDSLGILREWVEGWVFTPAQVATVARSLPDGFSRPDWNLCQVLGWILLKDRDFVDQTGTPPPGGRKQRQPLLMHVYQAALKRPELLDELPTADGIPLVSASREFEAAKSALRSALIEGSLIVHAIKNAAGDTVRMTPELWRHLALYDDPDSGPYAGPDDPSRAGASTWTQITFSSVRVMAEWPEPVTPPEPVAFPVPVAEASEMASAPVSLSPAIDAACRRLIAEHAAMGVDHRYSQKALVSDVRATIKPLKLGKRRDAVRAMHADAVRTLAPHWSDTGPPSKKPKAKRATK